MPTVIIHSDASAYACGGHALSVDSQEFELYFVAFSSLQSQTDSNTSELLAILYGLKSFKTQVRDKVVKFFTDNQNVTTIIRKGSPSLGLHSLALKIFKFCLDNNISLEVEWLPRSLNTFADSISRIVDYDDWGLTVEFYERISIIAGPFTVDCFATQYTAKCKKFYSKFWCPGSAGVDAFSFDWSHDNNWLVPPVHLVPKTIFHLEQCYAKGTLIVPAWKSAVFWRRFCSLMGVTEILSNKF